MTACVHTYGSILVPVYLYIYIPLMYPLCTRNCVCRTRGGHKWPCTRGPEDRQALIRFIFVSLCRSSVSFFLFQYSSLCPSSFSSLVHPLLVFHPLVQYFCSLRHRRVTTTVKSPPPLGRVYYVVFNPLSIATVCTWGVS